MTKSSGGPPTKFRHNTTEILRDYGKERGRREGGGKCGFKGKGLRWAHVLASIFIDLLFDLWERIVQVMIIINVERETSSFRAREPNMRSHGCGWG